MNRWILLFATGIAISACAARAHHSVSGAYDTSQQVTIEGVIAQFHFVNPHPYVTVEVQEKGAGAKQWRGEMDNRRELVAVGVTGETLQPGDRVIVTGNPSRSESPALYIRKLDRPMDGFVYEQVGTSPRIRSPR